MNKSPIRDIDMMKKQTRYQYSKHNIYKAIEIVMKKCLDAIQVGKYY